MEWVFFSLFAAAFYGTTSVLDNYCLSKIFNNSTISSMFYIYLVKAIVSLLLLLVWRPGVPSMEHMPFFLAVGLLEIGFLFPYFASLKVEDTSIVSSLTNMGYLFVPITAFFLIGETVTTTQYAGLFIILLSSFLLTLKKFSIRIVIGRAFWYMFLGSVAFALKAVVIKHLVGTLPWDVTYVWAFLSIGIMGSVVLLSTNRREILDNRKNFSRGYMIVTAADLASLIGWAAAIHALSLQKVTLVQGLVATAPFFILFSAVGLRKALPKLFKEKTDSYHVLKKISLYALAAIGVMLVVR